MLEKIQKTMAALTKEFEKHQPAPTTAPQEAVAVQTPGLARLVRALTPRISGDTGLVLVLLLFMLLPTETCVIACSVSLATAT